MPQRAGPSADLHRAASAGRSSSLATKLDRYLESSGLLHRTRPASPRARSAAMRAGTSLAGDALRSVRRRPAASAMVAANNSMLGNSDDFERQVGRAC